MMEHYRTTRDEYVAAQVRLADAVVEMMRLWADGSPEERAAARRAWSDACAEIGHVNASLASSVPIDVFTNAWIDAQREADEALGGVVQSPSPDSPTRSYAHALASRAVLPLRLARMFEALDRMLAGYGYGRPA